MFFSFQTRKLSKELYILFDDIPEWYIIKKQIVLNTDSCKDGNKSIHTKTADNRYDYRMFVVFALYFLFFPRKNNSKI